jgi:hypothetical protein
MLRSTCALMSIAFALFLFAATGAAATLQRTFVASTGNDANSCSIAAPCRGFTRAITQTSAGGEVIVLDSAGYGAVTITQSVSIIAPAGVYGGISVFSDDGITVAAGPTDKVVLRGLTINGQGGINGIHVTSGNETYIEDCTVGNLGFAGILINGGTAVHIARTVARSNAHGVFADLSTATTLTLTDSVLTNNIANGFTAGGNGAGATMHAAATRVTASGNGGSGFVIVTNNSAIATMVVADSIAAENHQYGVVAVGTNAMAIVSGSSLVRNVLADLAQADPGAVVRTAGNNAVTGRGAGDVNGTLTSNPLK